MVLFSCKDKKKWILKLVFFTSFICLKTKSDPIYLNNADPYPIFSSSKLIHKIDKGEKKNPYHKDKCDCNRDFIRLEIIPFYQSATTGTDIYGNETLTYYDFSNLNLMATSNPSAIDLSANTSGGFGNNSGGTGGANGLAYTVPMPLGAIPQPFNFFGIFNNPYNSDSKEELVYGTYPYLEDDDSTNVTKVLNSGKSSGNLVSKIIARYLGYESLPYKYKKDGTENILDISNYDKDPLKYDYENYRNANFSTISDIRARDPKKLFGYGYFDLMYRKYGFRASIDIYPFPTDFLQIKFKTGYVQLDIEKKKIIDTTTMSQGPTATYMYAKYDSDITTQNGNQYPLVPNVYQLNNYGEVSQNDPINILGNELGKVLVPAGKADNFKSYYIQNIQNNIDSLGRILKQDFGNYNVNGMDDFTFELFLKNEISIKNKYLKNEEIFSEFYLVPFLSLSGTAPTSPTIPNNKIFAKAIGNNGHFGFNFKTGITFDFPEYIAFSFDIGATGYNCRNYYELPLPTKETEEGIYTYNANITKTPGNSYTFGLGIQSDLFLKAISLWSEYRYINHMKDKIKLLEINPLLTTKYVNDKKKSPDYKQTNPIGVENGYIYLENSTDKLPYPESILTEKAESLTAFSTHIFNFGLKWNITPDSSLNFILQQPISLINAYNSTTFALTLEVLF